MINVTLQYARINETLANQALMFVDPSKVTADMEKKALVNFLWLSNYKKNQTVVDDDEKLLIVPEVLIFCILISIDVAKIE